MIQQKKFRLYNQSHPVKVGSHGAVLFIGSEVLLKSWNISEIQLLCHVEREDKKEEKRAGKGG